MKLQEYQSKKLLAKYGIPVSRGLVASTVEEAVHAASILGGDIAVKAQVLAGGRGKSGGIQRAKNSKDVQIYAERFLGNPFQGLTVHSVLIEEWIAIEKEIYLSVTIDNEVGKPIIIVSACGGMDIEELAIQSPQTINYYYIDLQGDHLQKFGSEIAKSIGLPQKQWKLFADITERIWQLFKESEATLIEVNPLGITQDGRMVALDAKIILDDNAVFRHLELSQMRDVTTEKPIEVEARKHGLDYVQLEGEVGCIVNGAGLAMAIMDMINQTGGRSGNFLDIGGGAGTEKMKAALKIVLSDQKIKIVLVNIFGGITRCDVIAKGIIEAVETLKPTLPIVVRLAGTNADIGNAMLSGKKIISIQNLSSAMNFINNYLA